MTRNPLSLRDTLTTLGQRLEQLSLPELQRPLLTHAASVPAEERRDFLDIFLSPAPVPEEQLPSVQFPQVLRDLTWPVDSDPLLADIRGLGGAVELPYMSTRKASSPLSQHWLLLGNESPWIPTITRDQPTLSAPPGAPKGIGRPPWPSVEHLESTKMSGKNRSVGWDSKRWRGLSGATGPAEWVFLLCLTGEAEPGTSGVHPRHSDLPRVGFAVTRPDNLDRM